MRQHHLYFEINQALLRIGAARVIIIFIVSYHHFSRCSRPNRQNVTLCNPRALRAIGQIKALGTAVALL